MREVIIRVPAHALDEVLDRVLPVVPDGVRQVPLSRSQVELRMLGPHLPALREIARAVRPVPFQISERDVPDDWRERRLADYRADTIGERLVVRPAWAPPPVAGLIDIVLEESAPFGAGTHPTTRKCLELLMTMAPGGSFADLGCGSGVLAILAERLGWAPVTAVDVQPGSVDSTRANAVTNGATVEVGVVDLSREPAPAAVTFVANVPPAVHAGIARSWHDAAEPRTGLVSGFGPVDAPAVMDGYAVSGFTERRRHEQHGWVVAELARS
jgi:ribosomal protein L11 methyltransferase